MSTAAARIQAFTAQNEQCAAIILRDPERHGGPESLMCRWANAILKQAREREQAKWKLVA